MRSIVLATLTVVSALPAADWPGREWERADPSEFALDTGKLAQARDYALTAEGSGYVIYEGKLVMSWGDPTRRYDLKSTSKSIGGTLLGIALKDGKVRFDDSAKSFHPTFGVPPETNAQI